MKTIIVPLDGSPFGEHALPLAYALAQRSKAALVLAHVHEAIVSTVPSASGPYFDPRIDALIREEETRYLHAVSQRLNALGEVPISRVVLESPVADALCTYARTVGADLFVLSTHGRGGLARAWLGSIADRLVRQSPVPTLVVHPNAEPPDLAAAPALDHIMITLDGSHLAEQAIAMARQVGRLVDAHYTLVQVIEPLVRSFLDGAQPYLDAGEEAAAWQRAADYLDEVAARMRVQGEVVATHVVVGKPAEAILQYAHEHDVDLIAMTTHGHGAVTRLLVGSVADKVLRGADIPLLAYRPPDA